MDSLKELYKIGFGPSSSHTMGPHQAALNFIERTKGLVVNRYEVELYGSLAATGKGHLTDWIIEETLGKDHTKVIFKPEITYQYHTNGMKFFAYDAKGNILDEYLVFSVGGGVIRELNEERKSARKVYKEQSMEEILKRISDEHLSLPQYVYQNEGEVIKDHLKEVWHTMQETLLEGFRRKDPLPGALGFKRRAANFFEKFQETNDFTTLTYASAQSVSEQNGAGGKVVTAPTCGSCGVLPGILYAAQTYYGYSEEQIIDALAVAGVVGNLVKENASISGAEAGCQAEVGTACSMAAAAMAFLMGGTANQIEYAAEIGLEHHLGLTCDPVLGLVQVPCIERNAVAAKRAYDAAQYALLTDGQHVIKLDSVIQTMNETGRDLHEKYRETALGGLATACRLFN